MPEFIVKCKKTKLEKYGDENYVNVEKAKKTNLKRYGVSSPILNKDVKNKMKKTMMERYGVEHNWSKDSQLRENIYITKEKLHGSRNWRNTKKYKKTMIEKYGVDNPSKLGSIKDKKRKYKIDEMVESVFFGDRLKGKVIPLFTKEEYRGSDYDNYYKFKCLTCGNEFEANLRSGNIPRCLNCYPHNRFKSNVEIEICKFLTDNNIQIKQHDRTVLDGNEIDILLPNNNVGIECNGIYWHSEIAGKKDRQYHIQKTLLAKSKNIDLIHIIDWEWLNKQEIIKSIILNKVGKSMKIYARKCKIIEIDDCIKDTFLMNNHIQGNDISSIKLGLFYKDELVSVMTFTKSRYDKKYEYELSRFCNKIGLSIIGGASKLFSHFIKTHNPKSVVSYSDRRFFGGTLYKALGMKFISNTSPSYSYFHKNHCIPTNRQNFQKHKLKDKLEIFDPALSEWENMQLNGYDRIWDCGHLKYEWLSK